LHEIEKHAILAKESSEKSPPISLFSPYPLMLTQLEVRKSSTNTGIRIFSFHGEIDETNVDSTFPNIMTDIGDFSGARTLFDLKELTYLNSKSIGYIADIAQRTEDGSGKFALANLTSEVHDTLDLVGITNIIPVYDSEEVALVELSK
jgi:anti-anti-sigma factor